MVIAICCCRANLPEAKGAVYRQGGVYVVIGGGRWHRRGLERIHDPRLPGRRSCGSAGAHKTHPSRPNWIGWRSLVLRHSISKPTPTDRWAMERAYARIKQEYSQVSRCDPFSRDPSAMAASPKNGSGFISPPVLFDQGGCECAPGPGCFARTRSILCCSSRPCRVSTGDAGLSNLRRRLHLRGRLWRTAAWPDVGRVRSKVMNLGLLGQLLESARAMKTRMARAGLGSIEAVEGMAALEVLLAAPQNQLALVKTTRPPVMAASERSDGIAVAELLRVYPPQDAVNDWPRLQADQRLAREVSFLKGMLIRRWTKLAGKLLWAQLIAAGFPGKRNGGCRGRSRPDCGLRGFIRSMAG